MASNVDADEVESDVILTPEDGRPISGAVRDELHRQALTYVDTDRTSSSDVSVSRPVGLKGDQAVSIDQEEEDWREVPVTRVGGLVTETRQERHASVTGDLHLNQTMANVKNENFEAVSSGVVQDTQTREAQVELTQAQEQLTAMRDLTSKHLQAWTTGMVHTRAVDVLVEQLSNRPSVYVLQGQPGEGKTTVAKMALKKLQARGRNVYVVTTPSEYFTVKSDKESVILLNDIFGSWHFDLDNLSPWKKVFDDHLALQEHKETAQPRTKPTILLVSRSSVLDAAAKHLGRFHSLIMNKDYTMDLTNDIKYTVEEKMQIWSYYASLHRVNIEERIVRKVCSQYLLYGFAHCCRLFAQMYTTNQKLQMRLFFLKPLEFLKKELTSVFEDEIAGWLIRQMLKTGGEYHVDSIHENRDKSFNVKKTICEYNGLYFRKTGQVVTFHHPSIYDTVAFLACKVDPFFVVQHCSMPFLNDRVRLADISGPETEQQKTVSIDGIHRQNLMDRMKYEIAEGNLSDVLTHASFHDEAFVKEFMETRLITETQSLRDIIYTMDKKTRHYFLYLCSINKSNNVLKFICERAVLTKEDQTSVLFGICNHGSETSLQYLLERFPECDLSVRNEDKETLLIVAAKSSCDYIMRTLIERGVSVQEEDAWSHTALHNVCEYGVEKDPSIVEMMVRKGADVNKCICTRHKETPMIIACEAGHNEIITTLLQMGADINAAGRFQTPLTAACRAGHNTVVTTLLVRDADINKLDRLGITPLIAACRAGHNIVVTNLLERDAQINKSDELGQTPLTAACRIGHNTVVTTLLVRDADINELDGRGQTPLIAACEQGHNTVVTTLLDRDADINIPFGRGQTPLTAACREGHNTVVTTLLDRDANINKPGGWGETPLTAACRVGENTVVSTLLDRNADINKPDELKQTPLTAVCREGENTIATILLDRGADIDKPDGLKHTPLTAACRAGHSTVVITLLDRDADINKADGWRQTPLTTACRWGIDTVVTTLLDRDADVNKLDELGQTPLTAACRWRHNIVVDTLLDRDADINKLDGWGETPLIAACKGGDNRIVTTLLDRDADKNKPNALGQALWFARMHSHTTVVATLLARGPDYYMQ